MYGVQTLKIEPPIEALPHFCPFVAHSLGGFYPCSLILQTLRRVGLLAGSPATWLLALGLWGFPSDPARIPFSASSLAKERHSATLRLSHGLEGETVAFNERVQH